MTYYDDPADRAADAAIIAADALHLWQTFDANERALVRFGMFPHHKTIAAEQALASKLVNPREIGRRFAVALMDCAKADGGMRA